MSLPEAEDFDLDEWIAALEHHAQIDPKSTTPVNDAALARLLGAADCRGHIRAMRAELDLVKDELDAIKDMVGDLPERFAEVAFGERAADRASRDKVRERCWNALDKILGGAGDGIRALTSSTTFVVLLGIAIVLGVGSVALSALGVQITTEGITIEASKDGP